MNDKATPSFQPARGDYVLIAFVLALVYVGLGPQVPFPDRFALLADALVKGELTVAVDGFADELIATDQTGRYFVAYPPLPAVVLMPLRAAFGSEFGSRAACRLACVVAVLMFGSVLARVGRYCIDPVGSKVDWYLWIMVLGLGTAVWDSATWAGDWHFAHALALALFMTAMNEYFGRQRWRLIGVWLGLALLARPTMAFSGVFFLIAALQRSQNNNTNKSMKASLESSAEAGAMPPNQSVLVKLTLLALGPAIAVALLAAYNAVRFGNPLDFGYDRLILRGEGLILMNAYGQFHPAYIPRNLFWYFFAPPALTPGGAFPFLSYDPHGLSIFMASPFVALVTGAKLKHWRERLVWSAMVAVGLCLIPLVLYFNTGFAQFGHRFSMDYLPLLMLLALIGANAVNRRIWRGLIIASILVHVWGLILVRPAHRIDAWQPSLIQLDVLKTAAP